ncbi:MAG TPA: hypothetical protein VLY04_09270 [Bryobacteraceae bacterium]|nr:hypothetical protein [Bryobacteraceae bacterium]
MVTFESVAPSAAVRQAQALLKAWVCGDLPKLKAELDRSVFLSFAVDGDADDEQLELLKTIAFQMKTSPDLFAERTQDPQLGLCVDLLMHLASCFAYSD